MKVKSFHDPFQDICTIWDIKIEFYFCVVLYQQYSKSILK